MRRAVRTCTPRPSASSGAERGLTASSSIARSVRVTCQASGADTGPPSRCRRELAPASGRSPASTRARVDAHVGREHEDAWTRPPPSSASRPRVAGPGDARGDARAPAAAPAPARSPTRIGRSGARASRRAPARGRRSRRPARRRRRPPRSAPRPRARPATRSGRRRRGRAAAAASRPYPDARRAAKPREPRGGWRRRSTRCRACSADSTAGTTTPCTPASRIAGSRAASGPGRRDERGAAGRSSRHRQRLHVGRRRARRARGRSRRSRGGPRSARRARRRAP